jgi:hypothetical protein
MSIERKRKKPTSTASRSAVGMGVILVEGGVVVEVLSKQGVGHKRKDDSTLAYLLDVN